MLLNYVQHIFPGGAKNFVAGYGPGCKPSNNCDAVSQVITRTNN